MTEITQKTFDYGSLEPSVAAIAQATAFEIHNASRKCAETIMEIGKRLTGIKEILPHGSWLPWIEAEFGWSVDTAHNFIRVYETFKLGIIPNLTPTVLYMLAEPSTPEPVREAATGLAEAGEKVTPKVVQKLKEAHKQETKAREERSPSPPPEQKNGNEQKQEPTFHLPCIDEPEEEAEEADFEMVAEEEKTPFEKEDLPLEEIDDDPEPIKDEQIDPYSMTFIFLEARERCATIAKSQKVNPIWSNYTPRQAAFVLPTVISSRDWHNKVIRELQGLKGDVIDAE